MKIKEGFLLREVAGQWVVVPLGENVVQFNGILTLSQSGALLWQVMEKNDVEEVELVKAILSEYEIDEQTAAKDVRDFISSLKESGLVK